MQTFFWHDYETFGADTRRDRPVQFAGIRTTMELEIVGEPVMFFGRPPRDSLPQPEACLITGITPQQAEREGVNEAEFAARVHEQLAAPGTCGVGYNSLRFDDEVTRQLLYRNFYEPYGREWENGNSRWDLIDLARMCEALRPEGIVWPVREDGTPSFKLEHLAAANHLRQERAHDALSDVHALIELARLIRVRQPRLWDWHYALRRKQRVFELLDVAAMTPLLHVSSRYPSSRHCLALIAPLALHPSRPGEVIVCDLAGDPADWLQLDEDEIADRVFTARADLPEDVERIPLRTVRANR
ncbi:MAG TPA: exodeoxyribonuclease I, partial [Rhodanobacter sp.]